MKRVELSKPILDNYRYRTGQKDFIGGNPVTLESHNVMALWNSAWNVTPKVDGTRYLCLIDSDNKSAPYFIDRGQGLRVYQPVHRNGNTPSPIKNFPNCILDGEIVEEKKGNSIRWVYWIFDILSFKGVMVTHLSFNQRPSYCCTRSSSPNY